MVQFGRRELIAVTATLAIPFATRTFAQTRPISSLPIEMQDVKLKLQAAPKKKQIDVSSDMSVFDQVVKVEELKMRPNTQLIFETLSLPWVALYADRIYLYGPATIRRTDRINLDGADGRSGIPGAPAPTPLGSSGNSGTAGGPGGNGKYQRIPDFYLFCREIYWNGIQARPADLSNFTLFAFDGYRGGKGGDGGRGGDGSDGRKGEPSRSGWLDCSSGPGFGGNGGNAGEGGLPGVGGNGSDGALVYAMIDPSQEPSFKGANCSVKAGGHGANGARGKQGKPGKGGLEGDATGNCSKADRHGRDGILLPLCAAPDFSGFEGKAGKYLIIPYTGFDELQHV